MADISGTMDVLAYDPKTPFKGIVADPVEVAELLKKDPKVIDAYVDERGHVRAVVRVEVGVEFTRSPQISPAYK